MFNVEQRSFSVEALSPSGRAQRDSVDSPSPSGRAQRDSVDSPSPSGKEEIDDDLLLKLADTLKVPVEAIKNLDEEKAIFNIMNNYDSAIGNNHTVNNPVDKLMEVVEKNEKYAEKNEKLYEALLKASARRWSYCSDC